MFENSIKGGKKGMHIPRLNLSLTMAILVLVLGLLLPVKVIPKLHSHQDTVCSGVSAKKIKEEQILHQQLTFKA